MRRLYALSAFLLCFSGCSHAAPAVVFGVHIPDGSELEHSAGSIPLAPSVKKLPDGYAAVRIVLNSHGLKEMQERKIPWQEGPLNEDVYAAYFDIADTAPPPFWLFFQRDAYWDHDFRSATESAGIWYLYDNFDQDIRIVVLDVRSGELTIVVRKTHGWTILPEDR